MANNLSLTLSQEKCINHLNGNAIVSASAGSGKTFVIIERIIKLVTENRAMVDDILAVTFTKLAANEMKEKLKKALIDAYNETGDIRLKRELLKVNTAQISTIHSFLGDVLKKYFYAIDLDSSFEILDEKKSKKLANKAIDELFKELYENGDSDFFYLLSIYSAKRNDKKLKEIIIDVYNFSESENGLDALREKSIKTQLLSKDKYLNNPNIDEKGELKDVTNIDEVINGSIKTITALINITKKFEDKFRSIKNEENSVDFQDLQTLALKLFKENESVLKEVKSRYKFVFIDEYQDVNAVQETLIEMISSNNLFMVGDSKQSIYAFRGCNPQYFINKYQKYQNSNDGEAISLDRNFRSAESVVGAVNNVFNNVFTNDFGGFEYKENQMEYGNGYDNNQGKAVIYGLQNIKAEKEENNGEFLGVYSVIKDSNSYKESDFSIEELATIKLIKDLIGTTYYDSKNNTNKIVTPGDICVLSRSLAGVGESLVKAMIYYDIPVSSGVKNAISSYPEVKALHLLVQALCSMENDVALATVMLNFYDFNEDELALIRSFGGRQYSFYECVLKIAQSNDAISQKVNNFISWFSKMRLLTEYQTAQEVLSKIISESFYEIKLLSSNNGVAKVKRVERFIAESNYGKKPYSIKEFNEYLENSIDDISVVESDGEDTVKIMTAHASKGLEFPIVIVVGTNKKFNSADIYQELIKDRKYGIAPKSYNLDEMIVSETPARLFIKSEYKKTRALEEARLLYVELTRAKYELYILTNESELKDVRSVENYNKANSQVEFLNKKDLEYRSLSLQEIKNSLFVDDKNVTPVAGKETDENLTTKLKDQLSFKYKDIVATTLSVKNSVSEINHVDEYFQTTSLFGEGGSERGTAYHKFFELSSFEVDGVEREIQQFKSQNKISEKDVALLDVTKLKNILSMPIFSEIKNKKVYKEKKFCYLISAKELGYDSEEKVLIQGIIDLIVEDGDGVTLLDYKMSSIESESDLIKAYKKQMSLYKKAIENVLKVKVKKVALINILQQKTIELDI